MADQRKMRRRLKHKKFTIGPIFIGGKRENAEARTKWYRDRGFKTRILRHKKGWKIFVY